MARVFVSTLPSAPVNLKDLIDNDDSIIGDQNPIVYSDTSVPTLKFQTKISHCIFD